MTLALFPFDSFLAHLPQLFNRRARVNHGQPSPARTRQPHPVVPTSLQPDQIAIQFVAARADVACTKSPKGLKVRPTTPLRVLRVVEPGDRTVGAGRMRMSGSMADVCAELDRLVERESRQRSSRLH